MASDRREAFERLWREEYARVFRTSFLITGDRQEAADVTQEAFARAYERWKNVSRMERPGAWVQRVAANLSISWRRRTRIRQRFEATADVLAPEPEPPDPDLMAALRAMPAAQRAAIVLRFYADQSVEDTARALGKKPGTVKALTHQGIARLRDLLSTEEMDEFRH